MAEIEILTLREAENRRRYEHQDDLVSIFINEKIHNPYLKNEVLRIWNTLNKKGMDDIDNTWKKKIDDTIKSYKKDADFITKYNKTRFKQPSDNSGNSNTTSINQELSSSSSANLIAATS